MEENSNQYTFSYRVDSYYHPITEEPFLTEPQETVPIDIFRHASTVQAIARYLVDYKGLKFSEAGSLLQRNPKNVRTSYYQATPLPKIDENTLKVPLSIFKTHLAPLEALVLYLKSLGLKNAEIARTLNLDPRTTHTVAKRGEVKR